MFTVGDAKFTVGGAVFTIRGAEFTAGAPKQGHWTPLLVLFFLGGGHSYFLSVLMISTKKRELKSAKDQFSCTKSCLSVILQFQPYYS